MAKITLTTIKSFIRKNSSALKIRKESEFSSMDDCVRCCDSAGFVQAEPTALFAENQLGISGAWFVRRGRDYFEPFNTDTYTGFRVSNCCGSFVLAVEK